VCLCVCLGEGLGFRGYLCVSLCVCLGVGLGFRGYGSGLQNYISDAC